MAATSQEAVPRTAPRGRVAPRTHPLEVERLARQQQADPDCSPLEVQAVVWLIRAHTAVAAAHAEALRPLGLSPSAFYVLLALRNTPGEVLEPCQLADRLLISRPSVTGLLDTLQDKGYVVRRRHEDDRRRVLVELTVSGHRITDQHLPAHHERNARLLEDLTEDELCTLVDALRRVRGATPPALDDDVRLD
jgi:DNA-binding MarR family transcriptional regulator